MAVYGPGCHPQNSIWTEAKQTQTNRENKNVKYNIYIYTIYAHFRKITNLFVRALGTERNASIWRV